MILFYNFCINASFSLLIRHLFSHHVFSAAVSSTDARGCKNSVKGRFHPARMPTHSQRSAFTSGCYLGFTLRTILTMRNVGAACSSILSHCIVQLMAKVFPLSLYLFLLIDDWWSVLVGSLYLSFWCRDVDRRWLKQACESRIVKLDGSRKAVTLSFKKMSKCFFTSSTPFEYLSVRW